MEPSQSRPDTDSLILGWKSRMPTIMRSEQEKSQFNMLTSDLIFSDDFLWFLYKNTFL